MPITSKRNSKSPMGFHKTQHQSQRRKKKTCKYKKALFVQNPKKLMKATPLSQTLVKKGKQQSQNQGNANA